ncbi:MAG: hypothetical protein KA142_13705 [Chromatiaceae bacterium]|nr:hypothetical protein [Chromatiaceae bacterium]
MIWYENHHYQSQNWCSSTFLVHRFKDISRAKNGNKEWNNVEESGCHFTCFSMIIGVNPAYLVTKLRSTKKRYFLSDKYIPSLRINSNEETHLVWDKNRPSTINEKVQIKELFVPQIGFVNLSIKLIESFESASESETSKWIGRQRNMKRHIIAGPESHSFLVAGLDCDNKPLVWDPDTKGMSITEIKKMIDNGLKIQLIFKKYGINNENKLQLLSYIVENDDIA